MKVEVGKKKSTSRPFQEGDLLSVSNPDDAINIVLLTKKQDNGSFAYQQWTSNGWNKNPLPTAAFGDGLWKLFDGVLMLSNSGE